MSSTKNSDLKSKIVLHWLQVCFYKWQYFC